MAAPANIFNVMEIIDHRPIPGFRFLILFFQDRGGRASVAGEEQAESIFEIVEHLVVNGCSGDRDAVIFVEFKTGDTAIGGNELVLLADRFAQQVDLDMAGLLSE